MRTSNPVFQVLPTFGNQAMLAKDLRIDTPTTGLKHGQLAAFNAHTGLSVDATSPVEDMRDIYFVVGINRTTPVATAAAEDIVASAGQMIQTRRTRAALMKPSVPEVQKVVEVSNFSALCSSPYAIKIEFRNQMSYEANGYNQFSKTFNYWTSCCPQTDCGDCPTAGSSGEVAAGLAADINADPDHLVIASVSTMKISTAIAGPASATANATVVVGTTTYIVPITTGDTAAQAAGKIANVINTQPGSPYSANVAPVSTLNIYPKNSNTASTDTVTVTGVAGLSTTATTPATKVAVPDPTVVPAGAGGILVITGVQQPRPAFNNGIPIKYYKQGTDFLVSLVEGLGMCNGTVTTITNVQYPEGSGYDLQNQEYVAGGWNGKPGPYRQLTLNGGLGKSFELLVSSSVVYNQTVLEYEMESIGGADEYFSDLKTIIAIPNTDTVTNTALGAFLTAVYAGRFPSLVNDYAKAGLVGANTPVRDGVKTYADDGIDYAL